MLGKCVFIIWYLLYLCEKIVLYFLFKKWFRYLWLVLFIGNSVKLMICGFFIGCFMCLVILCVIKVLFINFVGCGGNFGVIGGCGCVC